MRKQRRTKHSNRFGTRRAIVIAAALLLAVAAAAIVALTVLGRPGSDEPVAWATLGTSDAHALTFVGDDPDHLLFGHHGGLLESRDGGRTWASTGLTAVDAMQVAAPAGGRIQVAGHEVYVESTDGGQSWQPVPNDLPSLDLHAFAADPQDPDRAWAFVAGVGLFATVDGGRTWDSIQPGNWGALTAYRDDRVTVLVAIGPSGLVSSRDGGETWRPIAYPGAPLSGGLAASAEGSVLYAATTSGLRRSTDQGAAWEATEFDGVALAVGVNRNDAMDVALVDGETRFYRSPDGGATWPGP